MSETTGRRLAWAVLAAGIVLTLALQAFVPSVEVFWSGDGGLKNMMAKQFARGVMHVDLRQTDKDWVAKLWADPNHTKSEGLHPGVYGDYIFDMNGKYFAVFPYPFPFVSAPFYALFGVRGYYILPILSLWALWIMIYLAMRRTNIESWVIALMMAALVFTMPITLYSATFWEHTLGLALAMVGIVFTLRHDDFEPHPAGPILAGAAIGLAVWFRPETMALMAILLPAAFVWRLRALTFKGWFLFCASSVATVFVFFALNLWIYGHPLGTHGMQLGHIYPPPTRPDMVIERFKSLVKLTVRFAPVGAFMLVLMGMLLASKRLRWQSEAVYLFVVTVVFFPLMVYMVPTDGGFQLGPRFAFIVFPTILLIAAYAWKALPRNPAFRGTAVLVLLLAMLVGAKHTVHEGRWMIAEYKNRVMPAYNFLKGRDENVIAVAQVILTPELSGLMDSRILFAVQDEPDLKKFIAGMREQKIDKFIFIDFVKDGVEQPSVITQPAASALKVEPLGTYGTHFACYAVTIPPA